MYNKKSFFERYGYKYWVNLSATIMAVQINEKILNFPEMAARERKWLHAVVATSDILLKSINVHDMHFLLKIWNEILYLFRYFLSSGITISKKIENGIRCRYVLIKKKLSWKIEIFLHNVANYFKKYDFV